MILYYYIHNNFGKADVINSDFYLLIIYYLEKSIYYHQNRIVTIFLPVN